MSAGVECRTCQVMCPRVPGDSTLCTVRPIAHVNAHGRPCTSHPHRWGTNGGWFADYVWERDALWSEITDDVPEWFTRALGEEPERWRAEAERFLALKPPTFRPSIECAWDAAARARDGKRGGS